MQEECIVCKAPLIYLEQDEWMECELCHKKELSKTRCQNGHYVCNDCHTKGLDTILSLCIDETSRNPIEIVRKMMDAPFCHMHGPEHHVMVGAALLTAYKNAGGAGMFVSILSGATPLTEESWGLSNQMTSKALEAISRTGGPRCCKRDSYLAILAAVDFVKTHFGIEMECTEVQCTHYAQNNQCIGKRCPFWRFDDSI